MKKAAGISLGTILLALVIYALYFNSATLPDQQLQLLDGRLIHTSQLRGKVLLVNFWASSCSGCMAEMPQITRLYQAAPTQGLAVLAIAMSYDSPDAVRTLVKNQRLPFMVSIDSQGALAKAFGGIELTPTSFLIDKQGRIIQRFVGPINYQQVRALIKQAG